MDRTSIITLCSIVALFLLYVFLMIKNKMRGRHETDWGRTTAVMTGRTNVNLIYYIEGAVQDVAQPFFGKFA